MKKYIYMFLSLAMCGNVSAQDSSNAGQASFNIQDAVESKMDYDKYANSPLHNVIYIKYSDAALGSFIDPVSYVYGRPQMWGFKYDASKSIGKNISADVYDCHFNEKVMEWQKDSAVASISDKDMRFVTDNQDAVAETQMRNRLQHIFDNCILIGPYSSDKKYYKTKSNNYVYVGGVNVGSELHSGYTGVNNPKVVSSETRVNGYAITLDSPVLTSNKSVAMCLAERQEFSEFLQILEYCALYTDNQKDNWKAGDNTYGNLINFKKRGDIGAEQLVDNNSYIVTYLMLGGDYTIYAPTNEAMKQAYAMGLPTVSDFLALEKKAYGETGTDDDFDKMNQLVEVWLDFVKYHIQDESVYMDNGFESKRYYSNRLRVLENKSDGQPTGKYHYGKPYRIGVEVSSSSIKLTDELGTTQEVVKNEGMYNIMAYEYWIASTSSKQQSNRVMYLNDKASDYYLRVTSSAVIHAINKPLLYSKDQFKYTSKIIEQ